MDLIYEGYLLLKKVFKIIKLKFELIMRTFNVNYRYRVYNFWSKFLEWFVIIIHIFLRVFVYRVILSNQKMIKQVIKISFDYTN